MSLTIDDVFMSQRGQVLKLAERQSNSRYSLEELAEILEDYQLRLESFEGEAVEIADTLREFEKVHSVIYRVKEIERVIDKIFRKEAERTLASKITAADYGVVLQDIIGVRALYLFPSDNFDIHKQIWETYKERSCENPEIRLQPGDSDKPYQRLKKYSKFEVTLDQVYRSIHYEFRSQHQENLRIEIQIRTVFEEGWSAINHRMIYESPEKTSDTISRASFILSRSVGVCNDLAELLLRIESEKESTERDGRFEASSEQDKVEEVLMQFLRGELT